MSSTSCKRFVWTILYASVRPTFLHVKRGTLFIWLFCLLNRQDPVKLQEVVLLKLVVSSRVEDESIRGCRIGICCCLCHNTAIPGEAARCCYILISAILIHKLSLNVQQLLRQQECILKMLLSVQLLVLTVGGWSSSKRWTCTRGWVRRRCRFRSLTAAAPNKSESSVSRLIAFTNSLTYSIRGASGAG